MSKKNKAKDLLNIAVIYLIANAKKLEGVLSSQAARIFMVGGEVG